MQKENADKEELNDTIQKFYDELIEKPGEIKKPKDISVREAIYRKRQMTFQLEFFCKLLTFRLRIMRMNDAKHNFVGGAVFFVGTAGKFGGTDNFLCVWNFNFSIAYYAIERHQA